MPSCLERSPVVGWWVVVEPYLLGVAGHLVEERPAFTASQFVLGDVALVLTPIVAVDHGPNGRADPEGDGSEIPPAVLRSSL